MKATLKAMSVALVFTMASLWLVGSAGATAAKTSGLPEVLSCGGTAQLKPSSIVLACADANALLKSIRWTAWSPVSATGIATFVENTCEPNCAAGKFVSYPATVRLSKPSQTKLGLLFSSISYTYGITTTQSLPLTKL
jgi:hypothetical protein